MPTPSPLVAAITAFVTQLGALIVGFGVLNNVIAGLTISATIAALNVAVLVYSAAHVKAKAAVKAAQIHAAAVAPAHPRH